MSDLKSRLFDRLASALGDDGFRFVASSQGFVRERGDVTHLFRLDFLTSSKGHRVQPGIRIRFGALDRIYHRVSGIKAADQPSHAAISFAIWRVFGGRDKYEFLLATEQDIEPTSSKLLATFRDVALPFFERYASIRDVDCLYNAVPNSAEAMLYLTEGYSRSAYATIAAKLAGNADYPRIVETYQNFLKVYAEGHHAEKYAALIRVLEGEA